ncbi:MAG: ABC transporter permease subunit, partial [Pseudomonadota bacterium]
RRAEAVLQAYSQQIAALRLQVRGVSPETLAPLAINRIDVSTREGRSVLILGMITYFVLFASLLGGLYMAIDATAGERDRNSLESLLALPAGRRDLMWGKIAATMFFMLLSVAVCVTAFYIGLKWVPLERLDMSANFTPAVAFGVFLVLMPYVVFGAGLLMIVGTFTKTQKEAQTYLGVMLAVPTMPILFAAIVGLRPSSALMMVPSLSQHLLITDLLKAEPLNLAWVVISVVSTVGIGLAMCHVATRRYERESILL